MKTVTSLEAYKILSESNGSIFTAHFFKRDGTVRVMNCRTGVKKYLKGGTLPYNPSDYLNIPVFDLEKESYRMIKAESLIKFKLGNKEYVVSN